MCVSSGCCSILIEIARITSCNMRVPLCVADQGAEHPILGVHLLPHRGVGGEDLLRPGARHLRRGRGGRGAQDEDRHSHRHAVGGASRQCIAPERLFFLSFWLSCFCVSGARWFFWWTVPRCCSSCFFFVVGFLCVSLLEEGGQSRRASVKGFARVRGTAVRRV